MLFLALLASSAAAAAAAAEKAEADDDEVSPDGRLRAVAVGLSGNLGRESNTRSYDWGPTLTVNVVSSPPRVPTRFKYELEYAYNDSYSRLNGEDGDEITRVRTHEFKYAKISLLSWRGRDMNEVLRFVPYAAGGVQYVDSDSLSGGTRSRAHYWTPTWGAGAEFRLSKKTSLGLEYEQNAEGGDRRITRLSLELKLSVFGDPDE